MCIKDNIKQYDQSCLHSCTSCLSYLKFFRVGYLFGRNYQFNYNSVHNPLDFQQQQLAIEKECMLRLANKYCRIFLSKRILVYTSTTIKLTAHPQQQTIFVEKHIKNPKIKLRIQELAKKSSQVKDESLISKLAIFGKAEEEHPTDDEITSFVSYCKALDKTFVEKNLYLADREVISLKNLLFRVMTSKYINLDVRMLKRSVGSFTINYKLIYENNPIGLGDTVESAQQFIQLYAVYSNRKATENFVPFFQEMSQKIHTFLQKTPPQKLLKLNPKHLITLLQVTSKIFQLTFRYRAIFSKVITILNELQNQNKLTELDHIKIYIVFNTAIMISKAQLWKFYDKNKNFMLKRFKEMKDWDKDNLLCFIRKCPTFNNHTGQYLYQACNQIVQMSEILFQDTTQSYTSLFKNLLVLAQNRQNASILSSSNISKITGSFISFLKLVKNQNEPSFKIFLDVLHTKMVSSEIAKQLLPAVIQNKNINGSVELIYEFADRGIFHEVFFQGIPIQISEDFLDPDLQIERKVLEVKIACIYSLFQQNMQKITNRSISFYTIHRARLAALHSNKLKMNKKIQQLGNIDNFLKFCKYLQYQENIFVQFHEKYKQNYFHLLESQVNQQNLPAYLKFCIILFENSEVVEQLQKYSQHLRAAHFARTLFFFQSGYHSKRSISNLLIAICNFYYLFESLEGIGLNHSFHLLCTLLSNNELIESITIHRSPTYFKILRMMVMHHGGKEYKTLIIKKNYFLLRFLSNQYTNLFNNQDYIQFLRFLIQEQFDKIELNHLKKCLALLCIDYNLLDKKSMLKIDSFNFEMPEFYSHLFKVMKQNFCDSLFTHIPKEVAMKYFIVVLRHSKISEKQLREHEKVVLNGIEAARTYNLYKALMHFSIPKMTENYQLTFLIAIISQLNKTLFSVNKSLMPLALHSLTQIINNQSYNINPLYSHNTLSPSHNKLKQNFNQQMQKFIQLICSLTIGQNHSKRLISLLSYHTHYCILNLCYDFNVVPLGYLKCLMEYCFQNQMAVGVYCKFFMKVSRLCLISNSKYYQKIENGQLDQNLCEKYLIEFIGMSHKVNKPHSFIQKILNSGCHINELILRYIRKQHPTLYETAKQLATMEKSAKIKIGENQATFNQLITIVKGYARKQKGNASKVKIGHNMNFMLYENKDRNEISLYGILNVYTTKVSASFLHSLQRILSVIYNIPPTNIYLCCQLQAEKIFGIANSMPTSTSSAAFAIILPTLKQFQSACRTNKLIELQ